MTEQAYIASLEKRIEDLEKETKSLWDIMDNIWVLDIKTHAEVLMSTHSAFLMDKFLHRLCG